MRLTQNKSYHSKIVCELAKKEESMIFYDPNGKVHSCSHEHLKEQGYYVLTIDLNEPQKGNCWDILGPVKRYVKEGILSMAIDAAQDIAGSIIQPSTEECLLPEALLKEGKKAVIASLILLTCMETDFDFQKHMLTVFYLLEKYGYAADEKSDTLLNTYMEGLSFCHPAKSAYSMALYENNKTRNYFFISALVDLMIFSDVVIINKTSNQDHSLEFIGIEKTAVFLIIPDEKSTYDVLANIYVDQVYMALVELARKRGGRIPRRVSFILDESFNLPATSILASGRGIDFRLIK